MICSLKGKAWFVCQKQNFKKCIWKLINTFIGITIAGLVKFFINLSVSIMEIRVILFCDLLNSKVDIMNEKLFEHVMLIAGRMWTTCWVTVVSYVRDCWRLELLNGHIMWTMRPSSHWTLSLLYTTNSTTTKLRYLLCNSYQSTSILSHEIRAKLQMDCSKAAGWYTGLVLLFFFLGLHFSSLTCLYATVKHVLTASQRRPV